jgi:flagellar protein FliS
MTYSNYRMYLETEVHSADPIKQVCLLYGGAMEATRAARRHLKKREIRERSRQIMRALAILRELSRSLDPRYEQISRPLRELYAYMQTRLLEANAKQIDAPLEEVEQLLSTLHEGWKAAIPASPAASAETPDAPYQSMSCKY